MAGSGLIYFEDIKYKKANDGKGMTSGIRENPHDTESQSSAVSEMMGSIWIPDEDTGESLISRINQLACENSLLKREQISANGILKEKEKENALSNTLASRLKKEKELLEKKVAGCETEIDLLQIRCNEYGGMIKGLEDDNRKSDRLNELGVKYEELKEEFYSAVESREKYLDRNVGLIRENKNLKMICGKLTKENQNLNEILCMVNTQLSKIAFQKGKTENEDFEYSSVDDMTEFLRNVLQTINKVAETAENIRKSI